MKTRLVNRLGLTVPRYFMVRHQNEWWEISMIRHPKRPQQRGLIELVNVDGERKRMCPEYLGLRMEVTYR